MATQAEPFILLARGADVALAEASAVVADKESQQLANEGTVIALERVALLSRKLTATREHRERMAGDASAPSPIFSDPRFRAAIEALAARCEAAPGLLGPGAARIAATLRTWVQNGAPEAVLQLEAQADASARLLKKRRAV